MQSEAEQTLREEDVVVAPPWSVAVLSRIPLLQSLLAEALAARGLKVCACRTEEELARLCASPELAPDVLVFVVYRNPLATLADLQRFLAVIPSCPVVLVALELSTGAVHAALRMGVKAVIGGGSGAEELLAGIQAALQGKVYLDPDLIEAAVRGLQGGGREMHAGEGNSPLSRREEEIVTLLCDGLAPKDVARHLHLSVKTIENHKYNIYRKCGVSSATELLRYGIQHSIVSL